MRVLNHIEVHEIAGGKSVNDTMAEVFIYSAGVGTVLGAAAGGLLGLIAPANASGLGWFVTAPFLGAFGLGFGAFIGCCSGLIAGFVLSFPVAAYQLYNENASVV